MNSSEVFLVYDGECPVCSAFSGMARIRASAGELHLVNAREASALMDEISLSGLDIDQGVVLKVGQSLYSGADAMHVLALMSSRSGLFNRFTYRVFRSKTAARRLYPLLRFLRNLLLELLGRSKINQLQ